jgi:DNA-binding SARP family transcriptional activator
VDRIGPIVLVEGDRYRLDPARIAVDYWAFLADAAATTASGSPSADAGVVEQLQRAHSLYRGPLAEGIDQAWILTVREATRRTFLAVTARLVRRHVATDPSAALPILETVRNLEPTNQAIYRDIMALQLPDGR